MDVPIQEANCDDENETVNRKWSAFCRGILNGRIDHSRTATMKQPSKRAGLSQAIDLKRQMAFLSLEIDLLKHSFFVNGILFRR